MDQKDIIRQAITTADMIWQSYVNDLSDEELLHRPVAGINHINWQLGHLVAAEHQLVEEAVPGSMPALPDGFADKYSKETAGNDDPTTLESKERLLELQKQQRDALLATLDKLGPDDLAKEAPERVRSFFPTVAAVFMTADSHWLMHAGQWAVVRRSLGKPPLF